MRADQSWCSLCYAQVAEPFDPLTAPFEVVVELTADPVVGDAGQTRPEETAAQPWGGDLPGGSTWVNEESPQVAPPVPSGIAPTPDLPVGSDESEQVSDVDVMLSMLAAEHRAMDPTSALTDRFDDKSTRIAIMVGGTVLIGAVLFVALTVLGAIF